MKMNSPEVVQNAICGSMCPTVVAASAPPTPASTAAITYMTCTARRAEAPMYSTRISLSLMAGASWPSGVRRYRCTASAKPRAMIAAEARTE